jgi:hypothetical protein
MRKLSALICWVGTVLLFIIQAQLLDAQQAPSSLQLKLSLSSLTSADLVEVRVGNGNSSAPQQALRAGASNFYATVTQAPSHATYTLGALAPGAYAFSLFRTVSSILSCTHELLGKVSFTVKAASNTGSSQIALTIPELAKGIAEELIERENPKVQWLFDNWAAVSFVPGLESAYSQLLRARPEVASIELNAIGFIPECPPPLGPAFAPGSIVVRFKDNISRAQAEAVVRQLAPQFVRFQAAPQSPLAKEVPRGVKLIQALVHVPSDWEALYVNRYKKYREVLEAEVIPKTATGSLSNLKFGQSENGIEE